MPLVGPNLWTPRQKPGPHAVIDWNHPLARGLLFFVLPGGMQRRDLVSGGIGALMSSSKLSGGGAFGPAMIGSSTSAGMWWPLSATLQNGLQGGHNVTMLVLASITTVGTNEVLLGLPSFPNGAASSPFGMFLQHNGAGSGAIFSYPDASTSQSMTGNSGWFQAGQGWQAFAVTRAGATCVLYLNGLVNTNGTITDNAMDWSHQSVGSKGPTLFNAAGAGALATDGVQGQGALAAIWNRALSQAEIVQISRAPYQFLVEPANPVRSIYLMGQAGSSTSTTKTVAARFRLQALTTRLVPARFRLQALTTRLVPGRFRLQALTNQIVASRFRLQSLVNHTIASRFRLQSLATHFVPGRFRLQALRTRSIASRFRLQAIRNQVIASRFRLQALTTRFIPGRFRLQAQITHLIAARFRLQAAPTRLIASRFRLQALTSRIVPGRFRLQAQQTQIIPGRFRLQALRTSVVPLRFRLQALRTVTIAGRFRLRALVTQTISARFRLSTGAGTTTQMFSARFRLMERPMVLVTVDGTSRLRTADGASTVQTVDGASTLISY